MSITRNLTAEVYGDGANVVVEINDATDMVHSFTVPNGVGFVKAIDRKLERAYFNRTTAWQNLPETRFTFKVDHYGN